MAIRKTKPTSPGRRFATYQDRSRSRRRSPNKKLTKGKKRTGGRNANGRVTARHRGGGAKRTLPPDRLQAHQGRRAREGRDDRVRPEPHHLHRAAPLRRRRQELHPRPAGRAASATTVAVRPRRRHPRRATRCRCGAIPTGTDRPQRRAEARPGRPHGPRRRHRDPGRREGRRRWSRCACPPRRCGWSAASAARPIGTLSNAEHQNVDDRQGRPQPPQGQAPAEPRRRDEPGRPPARRRRGPQDAPAATRRPRGASRRSATGPARRASSPDAMIVRGRRRGKKKGG